MTNQTEIEAANASIAPRRLNFRLTPRAFDELKRLSEEAGLRMVQVMRIGLGLVRVAMDEAKAGNRLIVTDSAGREIKEVIIPR